MKGSQILFADTCSIFFFPLKCNVWLMLKNWDTAHVDLNFQIFWKIIGFGTTGPLSPGAISWQWRTASHLTRGCALQLPVGPPAPTVLQPAPHAPLPNLPPLIMWGIQGVPTKHQALCKSLEIGKYNIAPSLEELANQRINWWITVLPAKCRTEEGINMVEHKQGICPEKLAGGHWAGFWRMNMSDSGRWLVGNTATVGMEWRTFTWSSVHLLPAAQGNLSSQQLPFPCQVSGGRLPWLTLVCLQPSAQALLYLPSVKTSEKFHLYQEEPAWLILIHLQLLQLRQHSHSGKTGYLKVILLFELFVLEPLTFED